VLPAGAASALAVTRCTPHLQAPQPLEHEQAAKGLRGYKAADPGADVQEALLDTGGRRQTAQRAHIAHPIVLIWLHIQLQHA